MLAVERLVSGYGADPVLRGVSFRVPDRSVVTVLGHNGAGKSSLVQALIGLLPAWEGAIVLDGVELARAPSAARVAAGLAVSFQDDAVFPTLSVAANLTLAAYVHRHRKGYTARRMDETIALFPQLRSLLAQSAYTLSGGERRQLSIAMALMSSPKLLVLDEPSTGLSPRITAAVFDTIARIRDELGASVLLIEQNVEQALAISDGVVVLKTGSVIFDGAPQALTAEATTLVEMF
jgi:branched-chain amino acid transport system ATP-binding protein